MIVPMIGPSILPMPPMTVMKMTNAVQSFTLNAVSGEMRSFCRKMNAPTIAVPKAVSHVDDEFDSPHANAGALRGQFIVADSRQREAVTRAQQHNDRCQARRPSAQAPANTFRIHASVGSGPWR